MNIETRKEVVLTGLRFANNILVEILSNHARAVNVAGADKLREAVSLLADAEREFRQGPQRVVHEAAL